MTIPVLEASNGLPMGVQLIGRRGDDGRLLRTARWLMEHDRRQARRRRKVTDQLMRLAAFAALVAFLGVLVYGCRGSTSPW